MKALIIFAIALNGRATFASDIKELDKVCLSEAPHYAGGNFAIDLHFNDSGTVSYVRYFLGGSHGMDALRVTHKVEGEIALMTSADGVELLFNDLVQLPNSRLSQASLKINNRKMLGSTGAGVNTEYVTGELAYSNILPRVEQIYCVEGHYPEIRNQYGGVFGFTNSFNFSRP